MDKKQFAICLMFMKLVIKLLWSIDHPGQQGGAKVDEYYAFLNDYPDKSVST